jgi:hypothetical protein
MSISLPVDFTWKKYDETNLEDCKEIYEFLKYNYIENASNKYRLTYSLEFIHWYLNCLKSFSIGIVHKNEVVGIITSRYITMHTNKNVEDENFVEIDFLCVKKEFRQNKLALFLIKEITRISNTNNVFYAIFTGQEKYYNVLSDVKYFNRPINIKHLYDIKNINTNNTLQELESYYCLPKIRGTKELIKLTSLNSHLYIKQCFDLYNTYIIKFSVYEVFTEENFIKSFINNHINMYVLVDNNKVLDFISYYTIKTTLIEQPGEYINDAYLYYYSNISNNLYKMYQLLLYKLKEANVDSLLALTIMDSDETLLEDLNFIDTNNEFYYLAFNKPELNVPNYKLAKVLF